MKSLIALTIILLQSTYAIKEMRPTSNAYDMNGKLIYTEKHELILNDDGSIQTLNTEYFDKDGNNFAHLKSNFKHNPYIPQYSFIDKRFGREDGTSVSKNGKTVTVYGKYTTKDEKRTKTFPVTSDLVTGQGLYSYITINQERIKKSKEPAYIKFLVPMKLKYYDFRVKVEESTQDTTTFSVEISNWFARLVAPNLRVTYSNKTGRLLEFVGMTNILDDNQEVQELRIKYSYSDNKQ